MSHCYSFHAIDCGQKAMDEEWQHHMNWVNQNVIRPPKATEAYTQKQLIKMGLVGIYAP